MKVFLSHSSVDKAVVGKVYSELGAGICHYDVATFDPVGFLPEQIHNALSETTHFILFASKKALGSSWVEAEIKTAFINLMRSRTVSAMVFLIDDGDRSMVPDWLQNYVIIEHPTPKHIACRILSEYDKFVSAEEDPPFYRDNDLRFLEKKIVVEASKMPASIMLCGLDGMGRKFLLNQLFSRQFRAVSKRKLLIHMESFDSDVDVFKALKGVFSLMTAKELSESINNYERLDSSERIECLAELIKELCTAKQAILLDAGDSLFNDLGEMHEWLSLLIKTLPSGDYPYFLILSSRRTNFVSSTLSERCVIHKIDPIGQDESKLLFRWWIGQKKLNIRESTFDLLFGQVSGNPRLIEAAAKLLESLDDVNDIKLIRGKVFSDLGGSALMLLKKQASDDISKLILAVIANCGHISTSELIGVITQIASISPDDVVKAFSKLRSFGFVEEGNDWVRIPTFLVRAARSFGEIDTVSEQLKLAWAILAESVRNLSIDDKTSVSVISEACLIKLKTGVNNLIGLESLILPSQCLRVARQMYDLGNYEEAFLLLTKAYEGRISLTDDGAVEVLRYMGMSAARANNQQRLNETAEQFSEYRGNRRAQKIKEFILGFDCRLGGKFDLALEHMIKALEYRGDKDVHVLRELSFLYLATGEIEKAKAQITKARKLAKNNSFIIELQILIELAFGKGYILHNDDYILALIDSLDNIDISKNSVYALRARIERFIALDEIGAASELYDHMVQQGTATSVASELLRSKILISQKKYRPARDLLISIKEKILNSEREQRRSTLPMVCDLLIQASSAESVSDGLAELKRNLQFLPKKIEFRLKKELEEQAAYSRVTLSLKEKALISSATGSSFK